MVEGTAEAHHRKRVVDRRGRPGWQEVTDFAALLAQLDKPTPTVTDNLIGQLQAAWDKLSAEDRAPLSLRPDPDAPSTSSAAEGRFCRRATLSAQEVGR